MELRSSVAIAHPNCNGMLLLMSIASLCLQKDISSARSIMPMKRACALSDSRAAQAVIDHLVEDGMVLGLGSGSMAATLIEQLANQREGGRLQVRP